ncbi:MAG: DUF4169 family protein [Maricaulaceae bacterium]
MSDNVIKFGKAKKNLARHQREAQAAENRIKYGRTKAEKLKQDSEAAKDARKIDGHKLSKPNKDDET